jgi:TPR repeat protein
MLVVAVFMAAGQAVGGEDRGEEYFQNAERYFFGRGVPQSDTEAVRWYRQAAEQDHVDAQNRLRERGLTWTVRTPEQQEVPRVESPTPSSSPVGKPRAPASKIPDDLGDLD